jgi:tight adherence protein B
VSPTTLISLLGGLAVVTTVWGLYLGIALRMGKRRALRERLDSHPAARGGDAAGRRQTQILRDDDLGQHEDPATPRRAASPAAYVRQVLAEAGVKRGPLVAVYFVATGSVVGAVLLEASIGMPPLGALLMAAAATVLGGLGYLRSRRTQRLQAVANQLPGALDMIRSSLQAGHSVNYALEVAVDELPDPLAGELRTVLGEIRLGRSHREALENLCRRVPVLELRFFTLAVLITREVGGSLSEVLGTLAETLRDRQKLRQQILALSAQGRASAVLLFLIPPSVALVATILRPGFLAPLVHHPTGRMLLMMAVSFQVAGFLIARKIVRPKELRLA